MSNPILATTNNKLDTRVKEPSGVVPPPSGVGSSDRYTYNKLNLHDCKIIPYLCSSKRFIKTYQVTFNIMYVSK